MFWIERLSVVLKNKQELCSIPALLPYLDLLSLPLVTLAGKGNEPRTPRGALSPPSFPLYPSALAAEATAHPWPPRRQCSPEQRGLWKVGEYTILRRRQSRDWAIGWTAQLQ